MAVGPEAARIPSGATVLVDADQGDVIVWPSDALVSRTRNAIAARTRRIAEAETAAREPGQLADGKRIEVFANLGALADVAPALAAGAEGCGLLRSEFLFLNRDAAPDEESQYSDYQAIASALQGRPLVIRTLDAGADKELPYLGMAEDENPQLGVRGIRLGLARPDLLRTQLRAILRIKPAGQCKIMLPMIADIEEVRQVRKVLEEEKTKLGVTTDIEFGIMVEVPSAAVMAERACRGRRTSSRSAPTTSRSTCWRWIAGHPALARQADALHPSVLRLIKMTVDGGARARTLGRRLRRPAVDAARRPGAWSASASTSFPGRRQRFRRSRRSSAR